MSHASSSGSYAQIAAPNGSDISATAGVGGLQTEGPSRQVRLWLLPVVVYLLGVSDLFLWGWRADALLLLLTCVAIGALVVSRQAGRVALGASLLALITYGLMPLSSAGDDGPAAWVTGTVVMLISGLVILWIAHRLADQTEVALAQARQETRSLAKTVLDTRFDALQTTNQRLSRRLHLVEASLDAMQALSSASDVPNLLNVAVQAISEHFGFPLVTAYMVDEAAEVLTLREASSAEGKDLALRGLRLRCAGDGPLGWVAVQGRPRAMTYAERQHEESGYLAALAPAGTQATLTLPLRVGHRSLGVLDIYRTDGVAFPAEEMTLMENLVNALASALQRAERVGGEEMGSEISRLIYRTVAKLAKARSEGEVHDILLDAIETYGPARVLLIETASADGPAYRSHGGIVGRPRVVVDWQKGEVVTEPYDLAEPGMVATTSQTTPFLTPSLVDVALFGLALETPLWVWDLSDLDMDLSPELRGALAGLSENFDGDAGAISAAPRLAAWARVHGPGR